MWRGRRGAAQARLGLRTRLAAGASWRPRRDIDHAALFFQQAVAQHEEVGDPFGRARALLALGIVRRRARQKRAARDAILAALAGFEELGAAT